MYLSWVSLMIILSKKSNGKTVYKKFHDVFSARKFLFSIEGEGFGQCHLWE